MLLIHSTLLTLAAVLQTLPETCEGEQSCTSTYWGRFVILSVRPPGLYGQAFPYFGVVRYERNQLPISESLGQLVVSGGSGDDLRLALSTSGAALNEGAELLLDRPEILMPEPVELSLIAVTIAALGLGDGGCLEEVFAAAMEQGLALCPLATAVHLRLVHTERESSDPELRRQQPPEGALKIASPILDSHLEVPKGFYLRTVKGQRWLRGYRCSLDFVLPPTMTYVFARAEHAQ